MAWYETALLVLSGLFLIALIVVVIRHFPEIASIEVDKLPEEKQQKTKNTMAEQRLKRKVKDVVGGMSRHTKPIISLLKAMTDHWQEKVKELEKKYKAEHVYSKSVTQSGQESLRQKIVSLVKQARVEFSQDNPERAEELYIEVIQLDPKSIDAFTGLGEVYLAQKKFSEAVEIYHYILKMLKDKDMAAEHLASWSPSSVDREEKERVVLSEEAKVYMQLSEVYLAQGKTEAARSELEKSVKLEPRHPKYLDALIELCIVMGDKVRAQELFFVFQETNPDNKKLKEIKERIDKL